MGLICFAVDNLDSFKNVTAKWIPEFRATWPHLSFLLVGTKMDLRSQSVGSNQNRDPGPPIAEFITTKQGEELAKTVKAIGFVECSALSGEGVKDVFEEVLSPCF